MRYVLVVGWLVLAIGAVAPGCSGSAPRSADPCSASVSGWGFSQITAYAGSAGRDNGGAGLPSAIALGGAYRGLGTTADDAALSGYSLPRGTLRFAGAKTPSPASTPKTTWKRSAVVPNASKLSIGDKEELPLEAMDVSVRIDGFRARVTLDLFYRNTREEQLRGRFSLRLPNGASPYYLAFGATVLEKALLSDQIPATIGEIRAQRTETWENPKEARMVPREKAAYAFNETVRQQIDPALMEWAGAGVFSTSVYPLEPGKLHRIVIGYDVDLIRLGEAYLYRLDLPAGVPDLEVDLTSTETDLVMNPAPTSKKEGRYHWRNPKTRTLSVRTPARRGIMLQGEDAGGQPRFATRFRPSLPETAVQPKRRAVFLMDVSLSTNPDQYNVQLALLESILKENRDDLREFALGFFHVETFWWKSGFHANSSANVAAALAFARSLALEGATDLSQALTATTELDGDFDLFLLSDGAVTWGEGDLHTLSKSLGSHRALFAYAAGLAGTDLPALAHLTRESGGAVFAVTSEEDVVLAATAHRKRPWKLTGISIEGGDDLIMAGRPITIYPGQELTLAGRGAPTEDAPVVLRLTQGAKTATIETRIEEHFHSALAPRTYGAIAVAQLESVVEDPAVARAYATHYRVVGKTCSLLMLDSEADYERYGIKPDEDTFLVEQQRASGVVSETLKARGDSLGDPKRRLLAWLGRLEGMDHVSIKLPDSVKLALKAMPVDAFHVVVPPVTTKLRRSADLPPKLRTALAERSLTYEAITADAARRKKTLGSADAMRSLSSLVEHQPGDLVLACDVAFTLMAWDLDGQAYGLLRRVVEKRPQQTPTFYAIALTLEELGKIDLAMVFFEATLASTSTDFGDLELIATFDYLRMLRRIERGQAQTTVPAFARARLATLREKPKVKEADIVIVMTWNTDRTDVDLHVTDPRGEVCMYDHRETKIGGHMTADVTSGFGPEMFVLRRAVPGTYVAEANYYGVDGSSLSTRSKVYVTIYEDWGREHEQVQRKTVLLSEGKEKKRIHTIRRSKARGAAGR